MTISLLSLLFLFHAADLAPQEPRPPLAPLAEAILQQDPQEDVNWEKEARIADAKEALDAVAPRPAWERSVTIGLIVAGVIALTLAGMFFGKKLRV